MAIWGDIGEVQENHVYYTHRSLKRGSLHAMKGWGDALGFGQVAEDRSKEKG